MHLELFFLNGWHFWFTTNRTLSLRHSRGGGEARWEKGARYCSWIPKRGTAALGGCRQSRGWSVANGSATWHCWRMLSPIWRQPAITTAGAGAWRGPTAKCQRHDGRPVKGGCGWGRPAGQLGKRAWATAGAGNPPISVVLCCLPLLAVAVQSKAKHTRPKLRRSGPCEPPHAAPADSGYACMETSQWSRFLSYPAFFRSLHLSYAPVGLLPSLKNGNALPWPPPLRLVHLGVKCSSLTALIASRLVAARPGYVEQLRPQGNGCLQASPGDRGGGEAAPTAAACCSPALSRPFQPMKEGRCFPAPTSTKSMLPWEPLIISPDTITKQSADADDAASKKAEPNPCNAMQCKRRSRRF